MPKTKRELQSEIETLWGILTHEVSERERLAAKVDRLVRRVAKIEAGDE